MRLTLRWRIFLTQLPLLVLLVILGTAGAILLYKLGGSIDAILRENYASVIAMERLSESVERIDSSFQLALLKKEDTARQQYDRSWRSYREHLHSEENNITIEDEGNLVVQLKEITEKYQALGDRFFATPTSPGGRHDLYFGTGGEPEGLLAIFEQIKHISGEIRRINQENMEEASRKSQSLATTSLFWFGIGLAGAALAAGWLALRTARTILRPLQAVTDSTLAISRGNLDQVVPVLSHDELGELADTFNLMARQLRSYRQTDYARLIRVQQTSQATIDSFPDPLLVIDPDGRLEMANPAARQLLGAIPPLPEQLPGPAWRLPEPLRQPLTDALHSQKPYLPERFDQAISLACAGQEHLFLPRILPIQDAFSRTVGAAVLLQDVTRFQLLDQLKSSLVATVSHQLKTPLTSLRLAVHLLLEEVVGSLNPKQTELLLDARDNAERLLATINNLLNLSRLESAQAWLDVHPEAPAALLESAAEAIRPRARDKNLEVELDAAPDLPEVGVDGERMGLALANLLDNAVTYTPPGGRITLAASTAADHVRLTVSDTGPGIPREYLPHVFEKFFHIPGRSADSGTGLGLAIVHEIITAHRGSITCDSSPGTGTTFHILLPIVPKGPVPGGAIASASGARD